MPESLPRQSARGAWWAQPIARLTPADRRQAFQRILDERDNAVELLVRVDSIASLIAHRYSTGLPDDVRAELLETAHACRRLVSSRAEHSDEF